MATVVATSGIDTFDGLLNTSPGNDTITAAYGTANLGDTWNGGDGTDTLFLSSKVVKMALSAVAIGNVENLLTGTHNDAVTVTIGQLNDFSAVNLGKGKDTLSVGVSGSADVSTETLATVTGAETMRLVGSANKDTIILTGTQLNSFTLVNMGLGKDTLAITSTSTRLNSLSDSGLSGLEAVSAAGAAAGVTINLSLQGEAMTITGSASGDIVTGGRGADVIKTGDGDDVIQLSSLQIAAGESIDGGIGADRLVLTGAGGVFDFSNSGLTAIEALTGSAGADTVTLSAAQWATLATLDLGAATDTVDVLASGDISAAILTTVTAVETSNLVGTASNDTFAATGEQFDALVTANGKSDFGTGTDRLALFSSSLRLNALTDIALIGLEQISTAAATGAVIINLSQQSEGFTLTGGSGADAVTGGNGNDKISGGGGADSLAGGAGNDTLDYSGSTAKVSVNLATAAVAAFAATD